MNKQKYIEAGKFVECFGNWYTEEGTENGFIGTIKDLAEQMPAADVEEVRHGRWEWNKRLCEWYCSNCDRIMTPYIVEKSEGEYEMAQPNYCGWCGARMDGGENG